MLAGPSILFSYDVTRCDVDVDSLQKFRRNVVHLEVGLR
jgi:hypothetical protein